MTFEAKQAVQAIIDLADARLRNTQDLTPNTDHDLREILRLAISAYAKLPNPGEDPGPHRT